MVRFGSIFTCEYEKRIRPGPIGTVAPSSQPSAFGFVLNTPIGTMPSFCVLSFTFEYSPNSLTTPKSNNLAALRALQAGQVDAVFLIGPAQFPAIWQALHDPDLKLLSLARAEAYPRKFPYITKLTLPPGTIDLALHIPEQEVKLIGTKAMLVSRDGLSPAIVTLFLEAGRELHGQQGCFESDGEFPNTAPVDLPVSADANRHHRFGPSLLHRYLPFVVAAYVERLIVLLVPIVFVIVPLSNLLPRMFRWRIRSRIYRWYGELALLERD